MDGWTKTVATLVWNAQMLWEALRSQPFLKQNAPPPPLAKACRRSWKSCSLPDIMHYAEHEEDVQNGQDALRRTRKQERLDDGQLTIYNAMANGARGRRQGRGRDTFQNSAIVPRDDLRFLVHIPFCPVVDLANAFFSMPVHPECECWLAFTFQGRSYT